MSSLLRGLTGLFSLHENCTYGRFSLIRSCLLLGADVNSKSGHTELDTTPLQAACYNGHLDVVKYLIEGWNANPLILSSDGYTCLHYASSNGFLPIVKYLLESTHPPSLPMRKELEATKDGWTVLHCAAANGFLPVVKYLVETQKMDTEFTTFNGWTPLHWSCCNGYLNVVQFLLSSNPSLLTLRTNCGSTIFHLASRTGQVMVVEWLMKKYWREKPASEVVEEQKQLQAMDGSVAVTVKVEENDSVASSTAPTATISSSASPSSSSPMDSTTSTISPATTIASADSAASSSTATTPASSLSTAASSSSTATTTAGSSTTPSSIHLSHSFLLSPNDAGLDAFTLACISGHFSLVQLYVKYLGTYSFTLAHVQRAHDLHEMYTKRKYTKNDDATGGEGPAATTTRRRMNVEMMKFLRKWILEMQYKDKVDGDDGGEEEKDDNDEGDEEDEATDSEDDEAAVASKNDGETKVETKSMKEFVSPSSSLESVAEKTTRTTADNDDEDEDSDEEPESDLEPLDNAVQLPPSSSRTELDNAHLARSPLGAEEEVVEMEVKTTLPVVGTSTSTST